MSKILLVDDDTQALDSMKKILELSHYEVVTASDGQMALEQLRGVAAGFDLIITDVRMPKLGGLEFLRALSLCGDKTPVILMTAFGRVEDAVWAMKLGAVDFLSKPFKRQTLITAVETVLKRSKPVKRTEEIQAWGNLVGHSLAMRDLKTMISQVAPTVASVLLSGESGTGKELVAKCIHENSSRAKKRFIALNCAAIPENLLESELFGYDKGAFTGATQAKEGLFEAAHEGTLLLDEIGDMPLPLQAKLLRVLQENETRRLGSTFSRKVEVRVIAATHRNLKQRAAQGLFREDLLYRLEVIAIQIPPLRERLEDIPDLAYHFLKLANTRHGKSLQGISEDAMSVLLTHAWPGNIRELSNVIERAAVFARSINIEALDLPAHLLELAPRQSEIKQTLASSSSVSIPFGTPLKDVEDILIRHTLEATDGDKNMTAKLLGINSRTIYRKLDRT
jgi:two-component system response regulator HydG